MGFLVDLDFPIRVEGGQYDATDILFIYAQEVSTRTPGDGSFLDYFFWMHRLHRKEGNWEGREGYDTHDTDIQLFSLLSLTYCNISRVSRSIGLGAKGVWAFTEPAFLVTKNMKPRGTLGGEKWDGMGVKRGSSKKLETRYIYQWS